MPATISPPTPTQPTGETEARPFDMLRRLAQTSPSQPQDRSTQLVLAAVNYLVQAAQMNPELQPAVRSALESLRAGVTSPTAAPPPPPMRGRGRGMGGMGRGMGLRRQRPAPPEEMSESPEEELP